MNTREKEFAEFAFKCVVGRPPTTDRDRHQVLEIRDALKKEFRTSKFEPVRKKLSQRFSELKQNISNTLKGTDKVFLERHL